MMNGLELEAVDGPRSVPQKKRLRIATNDRFIEESSSLFAEIVRRKAQLAKNLCMMFVQERSRAHPERRSAEGHAACDNLHRSNLRVGHLSYQTQVLDLRVHSHLV